MILEGSSKEISQEKWDGVLVTDGALVPVIGDLLMTLSPGEGARFASDGEK
jgi:hypothetical protein